MPELTTEEEEMLFESKEFVCHNPEALQCTLWWFFSLHFVFRAKDVELETVLGRLGISK